MVWFDVYSEGMGCISVRRCVVEDARAAGADGCSIAVGSSERGAMGNADGGELGGSIVTATGTGNGIAGDTAMKGGTVSTGAGEIRDGFVDAMIERSGT